MSRSSFGPFVLDRVKRTLVRDGEIVKLTSRSFDLLALLVDSRGQTVAKDEILAKVWGDKIVEDNNLFRHVSRVRGALGERPGEHAYVVTIPGEGYRFVGEVTELRDDVPAAVPVHAEETVPSTVAAPLADPVATFDSRRNQVAYFIAAVVVIGLVVAGAVLPRTVAESAVPSALRQVTFDRGFPRQPTWAPNGDELAFTSERSGNSDIWVQRLSDGHLTQLTRSKFAESAPAWSPDGKSIAFQSDRDGGGIFVMPSAGGEERRVTLFGERPRWSPDGQRLLLSSRTLGIKAPVLYVVDIDGGEPRQVAGPTQAESVTAAAWHPDGRLSVLIRTGDEQVLVTRSLDGSDVVRTLESAATQQRLKESDLLLEDFAWSPTGATIFFEGQSHGVVNIWRLSVEPGSLMAAGFPTRLTTGTGRDGELSVSPDGSKIVFSISTSPTRLWSYPFDAAKGTIMGDATPLTSGVPGEVDVDATADGKRLAYRTVRGDQRDVWEHSLNGGEDRLLFTTNDGVLTKPKWSGDGLSLAFARRRTSPDGTQGDSDVVVIDAANKEARVLPVLKDLRFGPSDWSPDGNLLLGSCIPSVGQRVGLCTVRIPPDTTDAAEITVLTTDSRRDLYNASFSHDRRWVLFQALDRSATPSSTIQVVSTSGGAWTQVSDASTFDDKPHWAPDARVVYFVSDQGGSSNVRGRRFDPSSGVAVGGSFLVTSFSTPRLMLSPNIQDMEIAITPTRLIVPITQAASQLWLLDGVGR